MRRLPLLTLFASTAAVAAFAGCNSLLGDFNVSTGPSDGGEAGVSEGGPSDTFVPDAPTTTDAPASETSADGGGPPLLKCDGWSASSSSHVKLDSLNQGLDGGAPSFDRNTLYVERASTGLVRVIARQDQQSTSFFVYTVNPNDLGHNPPAQRTTVTTYNGGPLNVRPITEGVGVLVGSQIPIVIGGGYTVALGVIPDAYPGSGALSVLDIGKGGLAPDFLSATFAEIADKDYFYYATFRAATNPDSFAYSVGRTASPATRATPAFTQTTQTNIGRSLLVSGTSVFSFLGSDPSQGSGTQLVELPASGVASGTPPTPRPLSGSKPVVVLAAGAAATAGMYNFAAGEVDLQATTGIFTWRVGQVADAQLRTFKVPDLPKGSVYDDVAKLPVNGGNAKWVGDDFVAVGKGVASAPGANFVWYDARGNLRGEQVGASALLTDRPLLRTIAATLGTKTAVRFVTFEVAWIETLTDPTTGGTYDVLYFDELSCH